MSMGDLKLYCLNITSFTIASLDWLEPVLKIMLLAVTIGYTAHKWWMLKKGKHETNK
jgi:hypothetical protein|tara:strand:+ start:200 stop:370 length:171 start_codon:yes stop_codon:yes gene_type:complete